MMAYALDICGNWMGHFLQRTKNVDFLHKISEKSTECKLN